MDKQGHQFGSHTWSHQSLDTISGQQRQAQIAYNGMALGKILGHYPTYMRVPFSQCASECQALMANLGYHASNLDEDIEDAIGHPDLQASNNDFYSKLTAKSDPISDSMPVIGHASDTVNKITEMMLKSINSNGFEAVTVGECLDDPKNNCYRHMDGSLDPTPPRKLAVSSPAPKAASANVQLAATSFSDTAFPTKRFGTSIPIAQSVSSAFKIPDSSSVRSSSAIETAIATPSLTTSSSGTSAIPATTPKLSAALQATSNSKLLPVLVIFVGLWFTRGEQRTASILCASRSVACIYYGNLLAMAGRVVAVKHLLFDNNV